ncbi:MAG: hypothetical protein NVSMB24_07910 [Mucilaginibacter sp.]
MMAIDNPDLSLKNLTDLQNKIISNTATAYDYQEIDSLVALVVGNVDYIKNLLVQNGIRDFSHYVLLKKENNDDYKARLGVIHGTILGTIDFLKSFALRNKFYS